MNFNNLAYRKFKVYVIYLHTASWEYIALL